MSAPELAPRRRRRALRTMGVVLLALIGLAIVVAVIGAAYEARAEARDVRAYPPPGKLVDVGGHRLHIDCVGSGKPTVVIEAGLGDWSATWRSAVQPAVAKTTRVCTYDRAGYGYSDPGPPPRTAEHLAEELHTLLQNAGETGPYVLVGHSLGGLLVRVYAHAFPENIAGVVLVDSMSPRQAKPTAVSTTPPPQAAAASRPSLLTLPARIGLLRLLAGPLGFSEGLAPEVQGPYLVYSVTPRALQAQVDEGRGMPESFTQAGAVTTLGDVPLIVLTRGLDPDPSWSAMQSEFLALSSQSAQQVAQHSGHNVHLDEPDAVTGAIVKMVMQLRAARGE